MLGVARIVVDGINAEFAHEHGSLWIAAFEILQSGHVVPVGAAFKRELDEFPIGILMLLEVGRIQKCGQRVELDYRGDDHDQRDSQCGKPDSFFHEFRQRNREQSFTITGLQRDVPEGASPQTQCLVFALK
jgi:hypothetical protein